MANTDKYFDQQRRRLTPAQVDTTLERAYQEGVIGAALSPQDAQLLVRTQSKVVKAGGPEKASPKDLKTLSILARKVHSKNPQK